MSAVSRSHHLPKAHHQATQTPTDKPVVWGQPGGLHTTSAYALSGIQMSLKVKLTFPPLC